MEQPRFGYRDPANKIPQSLAEVGMNSPEDLIFANYSGRASRPHHPGSAAQPSTATATCACNTSLGLGLNLDNAASIYSAILANRTFPAGIFTSTEGRLGILSVCADFSTRKKASSYSRSFAFVAQLNHTSPTAPPLPAPTRTASPDFFSPESRPCCPAR